MKASVRAFSLQKRGNQPQENEDAYWPYTREAWLTSPMRFAIADGATESAFSRLWARRLVTTYCSINTPLPNDNLITFQERTQKAAQRWSKQVRSQPLPWHALAKLQHGAFASLLGLTLKRGESNHSGSWQSFAVGDSCLFHLRSGELLAQGPILNTEQFGYHPGLIATDPAKNIAIWNSDHTWCHQGQWQSGDTFALMTDALAYWFLHLHEATRNPWSLLSEFEATPQFFRRWVEVERDAGNLRNDDTTLLLVHIRPDHSNTIDAK